ncbi:hypothetical protein SK128_020077 [Halocaridina rubra]|uniref:Uncharacterized protein n=1 Tax=Halocaridina rubra TaxID=373956 RepID=A0AAN8XL13_HALRR
MAAESRESGFQPHSPSPPQQPPVEPGSAVRNSHLDEVLNQASSTYVIFISLVCDAIPLKLA